MGVACGEKDAVDSGYPMCCAKTCVRVRNAWIFEDGEDEYKELRLAGLFETDKRTSLLQA